MTDWASLQGYAREQFDLQDDEDNRFSTVYSYVDDRTQLVVVTRSLIDDRDWVEIRSAVCDASEMDAAAALAQNAQFLVGALAIEDGRYDMRHKMLLEYASNEGVELIMALTTANSARPAETSSRRRSLGARGSPAGRSGRGDRI